MSTETGLDPLLAFRASQQLFEAWTKGTGAFASEICEFARTRLREDISTWTRLMGCKEPRELLECQRQFAEGATKAYLDEAGKLSRLTAEMVGDSLSLLNGGNKPASST